MTIERVRNILAFATMLVIAPFAVVAFMAAINLFNRF